MECGFSMICILPYKGRFCPYTGKCGQEKTRILANFTWCKPRQIISFCDTPGLRYLLIGDVLKLCKTIICNSLWNIAWSDTFWSEKMPHLLRKNTFYIILHYFTFKVEINMPYNKKPLTAFWKNTFCSPLYHDSMLTALFRVCCDCITQTVASIYTTTHVIFASAYVRVRWNNMMTLSEWMWF